jgi:hypothetical protein
MITGTSSEIKIAKRKSMKVRRGEFIFFPLHLQKLKGGSAER